MSYLCYFVFKIAYFFISHFYIIDEQNTRLLFIALLGLTSLLRNFFQVIYPSVYAEEFDRGEVKHYSDVWVTWWPLHNPDSNCEPAIVSIARKLKLFLDTVTIFLLHTLIPSIIKIMFVSIHSFCCTITDNIVVLFAALIKFCKTYLVSVNKEFIRFYNWLWPIISTYCIILKYLNDCTMLPNR